MLKNELLNMHYRQVETDGIDTIVKQFENGNIDICQCENGFLIRNVLLTKEQLADITIHLLY